MITEVLTFRKIKSGDIQAFEFLFRQYYELLCRYSYKFVEDMDVAEEIVQELFFKLWKDRENLQIFLSVKSYLYGAIRNNSLQYLEHLQVRRNYQRAFVENPEADTYFSSPQDILELKDLEDSLESALQGLSERQRLIFNMNRFERKTYAEIASMLSLSVKTIEAEMSKALKSIRGELKNYRQ